MSTAVQGDGSKTIILVDDNPRLLSAMARLLRRGGFVAAPCNSLRAALDELHVSSVPPAAAIIDVFLERGHQGFELTNLMRERYGTSIPIIMITGYELEGLTHPYWKPPPSDSISLVRDERVPVYEKPFKTSQLNGFLIRASVFGRLMYSPAPLREGVVAYAIERGLTPQETRALAHLACGSTRSSLPEDLGLSKDTVKSQVRNMLDKCEVNSTADLVAALLKYVSAPHAPHPAAPDASNRRQLP